MTQRRRMDGGAMFLGQEEYFCELLRLVKQEIRLYTKYAVRVSENGAIRHVYQTRLFKEELDNVLEDAFSHLDRGAYQQEREALFMQWHKFHEKAYRTIKEGGVMLPFAYLLLRLKLTPFEQYLAILAIAPELNREFERLYSYLQDDLAWRYPSLDLCIKMYTMDELEQNVLVHQLFARRELLHCMFVARQKTQESELAWRLKFRRDLLDYIFYYEEDLLDCKAEYRLVVPAWGTEEENINQRIADRIIACLSKEQAASGAEGQAQESAAIMEQAADGLQERMRLLILRGPYGSGKKLQIRLAAASYGHTVLFLDLRELVLCREEQRWENACNAIVRAVLERAFLVFDHWEAVWGGERKNRQLAQGMLRRASLFFDHVFLTVEEEADQDLFAGEALFAYRIEDFRLHVPSIQERSRLWQTFLKQADAAVQTDAAAQADAMAQTDAAAQAEALAVYDRLAAQFDFTPGVIREAAQNAVCQARSQGADAVPVSFLYQACQQKISHRLGERASQVNAAYCWEELVLEESAKQLLRQACAQVSNRGTVYEQWGFEEKAAYGRGLSLLFVGPPGTGKTMAAQVLAQELNLKLYKVDLSGVLSKYIGETQKNLREIFAEVKKSRSILFFDEADVLFSKRVDVSDARDVSANAQTAYLLQKMEEYDGITILATNLMQNFDEAYKRRMKFIIRFALPSREQRVLLWEKVFPRRMPLKDDLDLAYLAEHFELSGASIKNIALNAAFLAASRQEMTGMKHILQALQQEYEKYGKILGKDELQEYYGYDRRI